MARLCVFHGRRYRYDYSLDRGTVVVGRGEEADVVLDSDAVSRRHVQIRVEGRDTYIAEDLGTKNGIFINGKYTHFRVLEEGDRIEIAQFLLVFRRSAGDRRVDAARVSKHPAATFKVGPQALQAMIAGERTPGNITAPNRKFTRASTAALSLDAMENMRDSLDIRRGLHIGYLHDGKRVEAALTSPRHLIGWSSACDIRLPGRVWIGRLAASLEAFEDGYVLRSLSFWQPIHMDGHRRVREHLLVDNEVFEIRGIKIRYRDAM